MKKQERRKAQISGIIDTITDSESGKGMLGFVITFPNGKMQNQAIEYEQSNYQEVASKIAELHKIAEIQYQTTNEGS
ncbi:MAG: hypothetical protein RBS43_01615 [Candidatus Cloacimonas sp.]|jgi:hypothetical protein|nr:hypothetical protein [Candidatus Cloacimonas sp.]